MLNRRANERPPLIPRASRQRRETMIVHREAFKHLLSKYCQREIRDGRDFCLVRLNVLEYEQVFQTSEQAADQLLRLVEDICLRSQREKDRLCRLDSGNFILILPDTDKDLAEKTLERLAGTLAGAKTHYHQKTLKASTIFRIAHSKDLGANIESLLNAIGCCLDETGNIDLLEVTCNELPQSDTFAFENWIRRYKKGDTVNQEVLKVKGVDIATTTYEAIDSWANAEVYLDKFVFDVTINADTLDKIVKRTRVLQELDHPALLSTIDFQVTDNELWHAKPPILHESLKTYADKNKITELQIIDWCHQLLNLLIYLQSLVPPVIPTLFTKDNLFVGDEEQLILTNFEANYVFACLNIGEQNSSNTDLDYQAVIVSLGRLMLNLLGDKDTKIESLLNRLKNPLPKELNSAYKVRQALKPFESYGRKK